MTDLFISYRRGLDRHAAGRLYGELGKIFGSRLIFMDVDDIPAGVDFEMRLEQSVSRCNVLLAVIGTGWTSVRDEWGRLRLFQPDDFVRIEILAALDKGVRVVPVLIDGANVPSKQELPAQLHGLLKCQAVWLRHDRFSSDVMDLAGSIRNEIGILARLRKTWKHFIASRERVDEFERITPVAPAGLAARGAEPNLRSFIAKRVVVRNGSAILATALYEEYCVWCEEVGIQPVALPTFGRDLGEFGFQKVKKTDGVSYVNVGLLPKRMLGTTGGFTGVLETDVKKFYAEQVIGVEGCTLSATHLYEAYTDWCEVRGREPLALPTFGREIAEFGIRKIKKKDGVRYVDIALREDYSPLR